MNDNILESDNSIFDDLNKLADSDNEDFGKEDTEPNSDFDFLFETVGDNKLIDIKLESIENKIESIEIKLNYIIDILSNLKWIPNPTETKSEQVSSDV